MYDATGQPRRALELYEQAATAQARGGRPSGRGDHAEQHGGGVRCDGAAQASVGVVRAGLTARREVGDRAGEAVTLNNMAEVYHTTGRPRRALELFEQALPLMREVGTGRARRSR